MLERKQTRTAGPRAGRRLKPTANRNILAATVLLDELVRCGVRDVCVSPGSRSAPLTIAADACTDLAVHVHVDERCSGFFALGLARASRRPVALVCTSGSAAAHYHPAIVEAFETGVPLVVLSADRPPELLDCGAPQTTQQYGLFGPHVRRFAAVGLPRPDAAWLRWLRGRVCRVMEIALGPPAGPVHLDLHFDEPLSGVVVEGDVPGDLPTDAVEGRPDRRPFAPWAPAELRPSGVALEELASLFREQPQGAVVVGPLDANPEEAVAIAFLARAAGVPVLIDPLSGLRRPAPDGVAWIASYDAFLRSPEVAEALKPQWILRLGRVPTSKALNRWMAQHRDARQVVVDEAGRREDPDGVGALFVRARTAATCGVLGTAIRDLEPTEARRAWTARWTRVEEATALALRVGAEEGPDRFEGRVVELMAEHLPEGTTLLAASSMPIRELDAFLEPAPRRLRLLSNRGVNGIDGLVSTAFGIGSAVDGPMVALIGDLAMLHDIGGLAMVARGNAAGTIVVINNGGGGIFEYLPVADTAAPVEDLFVTAHRHDFEHAALQYGLEYHAPETETQLARLFATADTETPRLVEIAVERGDSVRHHRAVWKAAAAAAAEALRG